MYLYIHTHVCVRVCVCVYSFVRPAKRESSKLARYPRYVSIRKHTSAYVSISFVDASRA